MWGLAYLLSGRPVGPTKRVYYQMASSNLSVQEWFTFLSLAGHHGGSGAQVANRNSSVVSQRISLRKAWFLGCQDYVDMSQRARSFHIRKAVPPGGSSGILENTALANWRCRYTGMESWIHELRHSVISTLFVRYMRTLFVLLCCYDAMPVDWVSAQACPLDKKNGKDGCEAVKLINTVEQIGNSFVGTLLERRIRGRVALARHIRISTWHISYRGYHLSKGHCSSGACGWAQLRGLQQGCPECFREHRAR